LQAINTMSAAPWNQLISKIPVESFFGSYWRKQFYYEAGWNERFSNLLTWETYEKMVR